MAYVQYPAAYARATARNIAQNQRIGADRKREAWLSADATRAAVVEFINAKAASGRSGFFTSICTALNTYGSLTERQEAAVRKIMADNATAAATPAAARPGAAQIGDMSGLYAIFQNAAKNLKRPAIVAQSPVGEIRLSVAGANARVPGSINVAEKAPFGEATWFGRIMQDGTFVPGRDGNNPALVEYLTAFAADPAKMAAEHGHKTGSCCFCNRPLTDERSTSVGYGPVCAGNYGLPWGE